jgi:branched-chain amino acid transport system substrate-binding protein
MARSWRLLVSLVVASLVAAACGGRFTSAQREQLRAAASRRVARNAAPSRDAGAPVVSANGSAGAAAVASTANQSASTATATGPATAGQSFSGDNGGATDVGVTATTLSIGNVSIMTGPVPGFGATSQRATQAYVDYVNSRGGVYGRKLQLVTADDRFDTGANRSLTEELGSKVFGFVGSLSVVDDGGAIALQGKSIPDVTLSLSDGRIKLANNFATAPIDLPDGGNGFVPALSYYHSAYGVKTGAVIWPGQPVARARAQGYIKDMRRAGIDVAYTAEAAVTETNYSGFATQIQQKKVDVLVTALEVHAMASLAKALKQQGYLPKISSYGPQAYGHDFIKLAGDAAEGVTLNMANSLLTDPGVPGVQAFNEWFSRTNPGVSPDWFAIIAWTSADLFVQALRAVGPRPTRAAVLAQLQKTTSFDGNGFLAPVNPAQKKWARCFVVIRVVHGQWERVDPATGFRCA